MARFPHALCSSVLLSFVVGCASGGGRGDAGPGGGGFDAGPGGGFDAGAAPDSGTPPMADSGPLPTFDSGAPMMGVDAGPRVDAGGVGLVDAGGVDAGIDGGFDAGPPPTGMGTPLTPGTMTISGNTTGGPTWNRPVAGTCPASTLSSAGLAVPYEEHLVYNAGAGSITVDVGTTSTHDGYLVIYAGTTIPSEPLMCLAGDDDSGGSLNPQTSFTLAAGAQALIVATGFDDDDHGAYTMTIDVL